MKKTFICSWAAALELISLYYPNNVSINFKFSLIIYYSVGGLKSSALKSYACKPTVQPFTCEEI